MIRAHAMKRRKSEKLDMAGRVLREVRKAERMAGDGSQVGGTGFTILKLRQKPMAALVDDDKVGAEEIQAAEEIAQAFFTLSFRLACRGNSYEKIDGGHNSEVPWPAKVAKAVDNYQKFAKIWTMRSNDYGDPMLAIVIAAVVDEVSFRTLARDHGYRLAKIERALIAGLRDYAARAGFVSPFQAERWMRQAATVFGPDIPELERAKRRAAIER